MHCAIIFEKFAQVKITILTLIPSFSIFVQNEVLSNYVVFEKNHQWVTFGQQSNLMVYHPMRWVTSQTEEILITLLLKHILRTPPCASIPTDTVMGVDWVNNF